MENLTKRHFMLLSSKAKNRLLIASVVLNLIAFSAIAGLLTRQWNQGLTLRQITGVKDSQVTGVVVENFVQGVSNSVTIKDKSKLKEFEGTFLDRYRMTAARSGGGYIENNSVRVIFYQDKNVILQFDIDQINPVGVTYDKLQKSEYYSLVDKPGFIRQLNSFMKSVDPKWEDYK